MKPHAIVLAFLFGIVPSLAAETNSVDLVLKEGKPLHNWTVVKSDAARVTIRHSAGLGTFTWASISNREDVAQWRDLQAKEQAASERRKQEAAQEAERAEREAKVAQEKKLGAIDEAKAKEAADAALVLEQSALVQSVASNLSARLSRPVNAGLLSARFLSISMNARETILTSWREDAWWKDSWIAIDTAFRSMPQLKDVHVQGIATIIDIYGATNSAVWANSYLERSEWAKVNPELFDPSNLPKIGSGNFGPTSSKTAKR